MIGVFNIFFAVLISTLQAVLLYPKCSCKICFKKRSVNIWWLTFHAENPSRIPFLVFLYLLVRAIRRRIYCFSKRFLMLSAYLRSNFEHFRKLATTGAPLKKHKSVFSRSLKKSFTSWLSTLREIEGRWYNDVSVDKASPVDTASSVLRWFPTIFRSVSLQHLTILFHASLKGCAVGGFNLPSLLFR